MDRDEHTESQNKLKRYELRKISKEEAGEDGGRRNLGEAGAESVWY